MIIQPNRIYKPLFTEKPRYFIAMGGRASGRSFAASQYAGLKLLSSDYFRCAIMRFVLGDIRNSIFQEILDRLTDWEMDEHVKIKEQHLSFQFGRNKINGIGFRKSSKDQMSKLKSLANYNCIIIEEADEVAEEDFMQLDDSIRTNLGDVMIVLLLNPPHKDHWIIRRFFHLEESGVEGYYRAELRKDIHNAIYIRGTYKENSLNLNQSTIDNYERYKDTRPDHYYNMIRGLVSQGARGRIFKDWGKITDEEFEVLPYTSSYGLDFGFSNDPACLVEIKEHNDKVWAKELIYETGLLNKRLSERFEQLGIKKGIDEIIADSAEPKSIKELQSYGWNVKPATKGADSVRAGINTLLDRKVCYTVSSTNIEKETENYKWALDKNKEPTNEPVDEYNHAIDGIRYNIFTKSKKEFIGFV